MRKILSLKEQCFKFRSCVPVRRWVSCEGPRLVDLPLAGCHRERRW